MIGPTGRDRLMVIVGALALAGIVSCRGGASAPVAYHDAHPLPEEPLVEEAASIGTYGGRFVLAQTVGPKTFNAMMANETSSSDVTNLLFTGLASFNNGTQKEGPRLAKNWERSDDGLTWTFHLRHGAAFSDGHPITADDVLFSFEVAYDPVVHPSAQDLLIMNGKKWAVTAPDPYTVVIKTPEPNAMAYSLASSVPVLPKHVLEPAFRSGNFVSAYNVSTPPNKLVTSGAWVLQQYVPGEKTVLTRNPYWFGVDAERHRLPYLDQVVFLVVPDQDAADLKFRSGEVDGLDDVKPENYRWYEDNQKSGNYTLHNLGASLNTNFFWFNLNKVRKAAAGKTLGDTQVDAVKYAWFSNPVFRRAVSMAVDRDAMIPSIFFGDAVKDWSQSTPANKIWSMPDIVKYDYNVAEAKKLLASLHWTDRDGDGYLEDTGGHTISFTLKTNSSNKMRVSMANFIRDDLAKVGIKVTLVPVEFNTLITSLREDFQYDAILLGLQSGVPPDPGMGQNVWRSSGRTHYWNMGQPTPETPQEARIDKLMDVIVSSSDEDKRKDAWREIQNIVNEQAWIEWLPVINVKLPLRNRFGNAQPSVIPHRLLWNIDLVYVQRRSGQS